MIIVWHTGVARRGGLGRVKTNASSTPNMTWKEICWASTFEEISDQAQTRTAEMLSSGDAGNVDFGRRLPCLLASNLCERCFERT
jgi:hypothetical protein